MESTKYIGMDVHKDAIAVAVMNAAGKVVMESILENQGSHHSAVYPRAARKPAGHLGRRNWGGLAVRPAQASCQQRDSMQSTQECFTEIGQQERPH